MSERHTTHPPRAFCRMCGPSSLHTSLNAIEHGLGFCTLTKGGTPHSIDGAAQHGIADVSGQRSVLFPNGEGRASSRLGVGRDFSNWIKGRIERGQFVEDRYYVVEILDHQNGGTSEPPVFEGAKVAIEYHLALDMAKLVMGQSINGA